MNNFYFTFYSIGWIVLSIFFSISLSFCLAIKNKSQSTLYLIHFFSFAILMSLSYFFSCSVYHPFADIHRYFTIFSVLATNIFLSQFFLSFPEDVNPKIRKNLSLSMWTIGLAVLLVFITISYHAEPVYHFDGHYWDMKLDRLSKYIALIIMLFIILALYSGVRQIITVGRKEKKGVSLIVITYLSTSIIPAVVNFLSRNGHASRETYIISMIFCTMFGYLLIFIVFINYTKDRTTFMGKIVSICIITILPIFLILSYYTSQSLEKNYDELQLQKTARLSMDQFFVPGDLQYVLEYSAQDNDLKFTKNFENATLDTEKIKKEISNPNIREKIKNKRQYRTDISGKKHFTAYICENTVNGKIYEAGFSYTSYRQFLHNNSVSIIGILVLILCVVSVVFPLFFRGVFVKPLFSLIDGVHEIEKGNLNLQVEVKYEDEIGFLTHNFNNMVNNLRNARKEIDDHAANLENIVSRRTSELHTAMSNLESVNSMLMKARDELWGEMQLAKKIQTLLLPEDPKINGYDVAAYMETAAEVGGDYYDVINGPGGDWIIIGDASGHGIPAGLIMMMVQTAIRVTIDANPDVSPHDLLKKINKSITENIFKVDSNMYMTINAILCKNERFIISGLHQDILIFRAESQMIETIKTEGTWLGFDHNVHAIEKNKEIILDHNDIMMIYTDGITEAWKKDSEKDFRMPSSDMFGISRLKDLFLGLSNLPSKEIINGILSGMNEYSFHDDVTIIAIKRL